MLGRKKKKPDWLPAEPARSADAWIPVTEVSSRPAKGPDWLPTSAPPPRPSDPDPNARPPPAKQDPSVWAPAPPPPAPKPVAPKNVKDRELWADPVLSPWAPPAGAATSVAKPLSAPVGMDSIGKTSCPRCATVISYPRRGSPPWDVLCPTCGAKGRISK